MDIGSAVGRDLGVTEEQLRDLADHQNSDQFTALEKLVLDLTVEMARTPADVPRDLVSRLKEHLSEAQLVELTAAIAWEHYRARFNRVFDIAPAGFSQGAYCALPEHLPEKAAAVSGGKG